MLVGLDLIFGRVWKMMTFISGVSEPWELHAELTLLILVEFQGCSLNPIGYWWELLSLLSYIVLLTAWALP